MARIRAATRAEIRAGSEERLVRAEPLARQEARLASDYSESAKLSLRPRIVRKPLIGNALARRITSVQPGAERYHLFRETLGRGKLLNYPPFTSSTSSTGAMRGRAPTVLEDFTMLRNKLIALGLATTLLMAGASTIAGAQAILSPERSGEVRGDSRDIRSDRRDLRNDRRDIGSDKRDIRSDNRDRRADRRDLKRDRAAGRYGEARQDRRDLRHDRKSEHRDARDLHGDRRDRRGDRRDLKHDRRERRRDRSH